MRFRIKPWLALLLLALMVAVAAYVIARRERRFVQSDADMVALLPQRDMTTVFLNVDVLRRAKLLKLLQASGPIQEHDYQRFVRETGFDYARDIDALAVRGSQQQLFFVVRGNFAWSRLREYAGRHGGSCDSVFCKLPTERAGRWASYLSIQPGVIGMALGADPADVLLLSPRRIDNAPAISGEPVWISLPHSLLADPQFAVSNTMPLPVRIFVLAMQSAVSVTLSLGAGDKSGSPDFELRLNAVCQNAAAADTTRTQLEIDTKLLKIELEREHQRPSRADLTGLLTGGVFRQAGNNVIGSWPVHQELLHNLQ